MRDTPQIGVDGPRAGYQPALDGLRAISISLVVMAHLGLSAMIPGGFGVTLFFFISGYLITGQLLKSLRGQGHVDYAGFYTRRALRLLPAFLVYIALAGLAFQIAGGRIPAYAWAAALFYGANYADIWGWFHSSLSGVRHPFNILWSLAVEEHFYMLWPVALAAAMMHGRALTLAIAICGAALFWRLFLLNACYGSAGHMGWIVCGPYDGGNQPGYGRIYFATGTRLDSMAWGALMALLQGRSRLAGPARAWGGLALLALSFAVPGVLMREGLRGTLQGAGLLGLVPWLVQPAAWPSRYLCVKPAVVLGRMSYSLYLWHWAALGAADFIAPHNRVAWLAIAAPLSFALAAASYWCIERPMLGLRQRFGSHAAA